MTLEQFRDSHCETERQAALANAFDGAVLHTVKMGTSIRLASKLANATLQFGGSRVGHNSLAKAIGCSPRTVAKAIRELLENDFISCAGHTVDGAPIYIAKIQEHAEAYRTWHKARCEAQAKALRANTEFVPPAYPKREQKLEHRAA
ncbi:hypothetical protein [Bradyrhizobium manausense]|nr:hypothetical protein [Bradyrhizobium manausense]